MDTIQPALPDAYSLQPYQTDAARSDMGHSSVTKKVVTSLGAGLGPSYSRLEVKRSSVAHLTLEDKLVKLLEDARVAAKRGDSKWRDFSRKKNVHRFKLTPEQHELLRSTLAGQTLIKQVDEPCLTKQDQGHS